MSKKRQSTAPRVTAVEQHPAVGRWYASYWVAAAVITALALTSYGAALRGPFLFDDLTLRFASPLTAAEPLASWVAGVRPLLMFSYWLDYSPANSSNLSFHLTNVALHIANAMLVLALAQRLFRLYIGDRDRAMLASAFACAIFLLHPLQTESVAYIAGRSEVLSATFVLLAWLLYVRRIGEPVTWLQSAFILLLFGMAAATKEQAVATVPAILLLTDWCLYRSRPSTVLHANWRLYAPLAAIAAMGTAWVARILLLSHSAGAGAGVSPLEYFFTECRAILHYLRLFLVPVGQNADPDFPISHNLFEHGAWFALAALLAGIFVLSRQRTLIRYGGLLFLALLAPTSSFVPLADPVAEHRLYLPIVGLALVLGAVVAYVPLPTPRLAMACTLCSSLIFLVTFERSKVWSDSVAFWKDVTTKSPRKARGYPHLAHAYMLAGKCDEAAAHLERAQNTVPKDYFILLSLAQAYSCADRADAALAKLREAEALMPTADVYGFMGTILAGQKKTDEAEQAFTKAIAKEQPETDLAHVYRGHLHLITNNPAAAEDEYRRALEVNPYSPEALLELRKLRSAPSRDQRSRAFGTAQLWDIPGAPVRRRMN